MNATQIEVPGTQIARAVVYEDPLKARQAHLWQVSYNDAIEGCKPLCENQSIEFTNPINTRIMEQEVLNRELKSMLMQIGCGAVCGIGLFSFVYVALLLAKALIPGC